MEEEPPMVLHVNGATCEYDKSLRKQYKWKLNIE
jgi:hypothetical protein